MSDMDFSAALLLLKQGRRMARRGWIVDGKWVSLRTGYPDGIAVNGNTAEAFGVPEGTVVRFSPYFQMCEKNGTMRTWNKGDQDLVADDWYEVEGIGNLDPANRGTIRLDDDQAVAGDSGTAPYDGTVVFEDADGREIGRAEGPRCCGLSARISPDALRLASERMAAEDAKIFGTGPGRV